MAPPAERGVDEVYRAKPSEFVRARNATAARLRKVGQTGEAAEIQRLRKPSPALWAVNQLGHEHADQIDALLKSVDRVRQAQLGRRHDVDDALTRQRNAVQNLVTLAAGLLANANLAASADTLRRISATLVGAAADRDARDQLREGRLADEHAAPGFEAFAGMKVEGRHEPSARRTRDREPPAGHDVRERPQATERRARAARAQAAKLERDADRLGRRAKKTAADVERLGQQLRKAQQRLAQEQSVAGEARRSAEVARRQAPRTTETGGPLGSGRA